MTDAIHHNDIRISQLRNELKAWEKQFAAAHNGRKASKEDIKADSTIAAKYKEYNKTKEPKPKPKPKPTSSKIAPQTPRKRSSKLERPTPRKAPVESPLKGRHPGITTTNENALEDAAAVQQTPQTNRLLVIGPTPQKDGVPIGLFDNLFSATPQKTMRAALGEVSLNIVQTPSKQASTNDDDLLATGRKQSRTPQSSGKRFMLDAFATPIKRKIGDEGTPRSTKRLATPAFLRRSQLDSGVGGNGEFPAVQPFLRKTFGRSLSSMIQDMKRQEEEERRAQEEQMDEEMELLREMDEENVQPEATTGLKRRKSSDEATGPTLHNDTDAALAPRELGEEATAQHAEPAKPRYKKKGQKRQTKRVILRPVKPSTQPKNNNATHEETDVEEPSSVEAGASEPEDSDFSVQGDKKGSKKPAKREKSKKHPEGKGGQPKKGRQRINPNAVSHANFRSLKIKNKNSKAKGRGRRQR